MGVVYYSKQTIYIRYLTFANTKYKAQTLKIVLFITFLYQNIFHCVLKNQFSFQILAPKNILVTYWEFGVKFENFCTIYLH